MTKCPVCNRIISLLAECPFSEWESKKSSTYVMLSHKKCNFQMRYHEVFGWHVDDDTRSLIADKKAEKHVYEAIGKWLRLGKESKIADFLQGK